MSINTYVAIARARGKVAAVSLGVRRAVFAAALLIGAMTSAACTLPAAARMAADGRTEAALADHRGTLSAELQTARLEKQTAIEAAAALRAERDQLLTDAAVYRDSVKWYDSQIARLTSQAFTSARDTVDAVQITDTSAATVLAVPGEILFESGAARLTERGRRELASIAATIRSNYAGKLIRVDGHADSDALRRGAEFSSNWDISARRAVAVVEELERAGVDGKSMSVAAFGPHRPRTGEPSAKSRNRRVEIAILK